MNNYKIINCLEIGASKTTAISAQYYTEDNKINLIGVASTQTAGFKKGQVVNLESASACVAKVKSSVERMTSLHFEKAHVCLTGSHFQSTSSTANISINNPNKEITKDDVSRVLEASKSIPTGEDRELLHTVPQRFSIDDQDGIIDPTGLCGSKLTIFTTLITANTSILKNIIKSITNTGIQIQTITYSGLANTYSCLTSTDKELGSLIVDIGGSHTTVSVVSDNGLRLSYVLPVGGNNITNDLAIGLRISLEQAERLKYMFSKSEFLKKFTEETEIDNIKVNSQTAVNGIIKPRLEEIFSLVSKVLNESPEKFQTPSGIILCGGGSLTVLAKDVAQNVLEINTKVATPSGFGGLTDDILNPAYCSILGTLNIQAQTTDRQSLPKQHYSSQIKNIIYIILTKIFKFKTKNGIN